MTRTLSLRCCVAKSRASWSFGALRPSRAAGRAVHEAPGNPHDGTAARAGTARATAEATMVPGPFFTVLSVLLMLAGLLCAGGGVWWQLTHPGEDNFEERSKSGVLVALASGSVLFAYLVLKNFGWDSLEDWMIVLWIVTLATVPVLMLPRVARRAIVSCLVLFHFGIRYPLFDAIHLAPRTARVVACYYGITPPALQSFRSSS